MSLDFHFAIFKKFEWTFPKKLNENTSFESEIVKVSLVPEGDFVLVEFKEYDFMFNANYLWDKDIKGSILNLMDE